MRKFIHDLRALGALIGFLLISATRPDVARAQLVANPPQLSNLSTRGGVQTGDNVLIGGFIISGNEAKKIVLRGMGPSLSAQNVSTPLADPIIELHDATGAVLGTNDDWKDNNQQAAVEVTKLAPSSNAESVLSRTLNPGSYTVILKGVNSATGVALVEIYDLSELGLAMSCTSWAISSRKSSRTLMNVFGLMSSFEASSGLLFTFAHAFVGPAT